MSIAVGALALTGGCGSTKEGPRVPAGGGVTTAVSATSSSTPKPADLFAAAVTKVNGQNVKFTIAGDKKGESMTGSFDSASGGTKVTGDIDGTKVDVIGLGNDIYIGGLLGPDKWVHAQASKFKDNAISFLTIADPLYGQKFLSAATGVKQDQSGTYSGTVDLTKVTATGQAKRLADNFAKKAGAAATALPFTATLDGSAALSTVKITFPKADLTGHDLTYDLKITEAGGGAVPVAAPAKNKVTEAPADLYKGP
ncbi:hypothetical protein ACFQ1S_23600 [Kibdelosporangium lantanae]|uniref:Lipoprotein n=1 Tax=Kibdelosporangium lantanae TaxID=1497396 RepID=A0ABW3MCA9_9PSEU